MNYYWEIIDKRVGEIKQYGIPFDYEADAIEHAKNLIRKELEPGIYIIKVYTQSPDERWPATPYSEPISSEEFTIGARWYVTVNWGEPAGYDEPEGFADIDSALQKARRVLENNRHQLAAQGGRIEIYPGEIY